jgi:mannose-6-phosphate isomerase-like protein (cupin superfamily)
MKRGMLIAALALAAPGAAQVPSTEARAADAARSDPTGYAAGSDVAAAIAKMAAGMKPGQGFAWAPLVRDGTTVAALEYWTAPGKPAVHPDDAEYTIVVAGAGTLVSGGRLVEPRTTRPDLVEGSRIDGGTTRPLAVGDVMLIPAGTPHWFGVTGGKLVLLGMKLPRR